MRLRTEYNSINLAHRKTVSGVNSEGSTERSGTMWESMEEAKVDLRMYFSRSTMAWMQISGKNRLRLLTLSNSWIKGRITCSSVLVSLACWLGEKPRVTNLLQLLQPSRAQYGKRTENGTKTAISNFTPKLRIYLVFFHHSLNYVFQGDNRKVRQYLRKLTRFHCGILQSTQVQNQVWDCVSMHLCHISIC